MSWEQLGDIAREAAEDRRARDGQSPEACPNDGQSLTAGSGGVLFCEFDGYQWPRDGRLTWRSSHN